MEQIITKEHIEQAAAAIRARADIDPYSIAIVLGSGMGDVAEAIVDPVTIDYADVPHMVPSTAPMHAGRFIIGKMAGKQVICMQGRLHAYEGNSAQQIAFPIFVMHELGASMLIATNAAGGIDPGFKVGDLMLIEDHINLLGKNPCAGINDPQVCPTFFDMTDTYTPDLRTRAKEVAGNCDIRLASGVYIGTLGPSFETPAEIRAFRSLGADAVGMSTMFEVIAARACGMQVLGISMISNPAAGVCDEPVSMDDVARAAIESAAKVEKLLSTFIAES